MNCVLLPYQHIQLGISLLNVILICPKEMFLNSLMLQSSHLERFHGFPLIQSMKEEEPTTMYLFNDSSVFSI